MFLRICYKYDYLDCLTFIIFKTAGLLLNILSELSKMQCYIKRNVRDIKNPSYSKHTNIFTKIFSDVFDVIAEHLFRYKHASRSSAVEHSIFMSVYTLDCCFHAKAIAITLNVPLYLTTMRSMRKLFPSRKSSSLSERDTIFSGHLENTVMVRDVTVRVWFT